MDNIRLKYMLECIAQGKAITIEPKSRLEQYLLAIANKTGVVGLPQPKSKMEELLYVIAMDMSGGAGQGGTNTSDATATANEIRKGFTAYIASGKVEGTIEDYDGSFEGGIIETDMLQQRINYNNKADYLFYYYEGDNLDFINGKLDTSKASSFYYTFGYCQNLINAPIIDISSTESLKSTYDNCLLLSEIPALDYSNIKEFNYTFHKCNEITEVYLDLPKVERLYNAFNYCGKIKKIYLYKTDNLKDLESAFSMCSQLKEVYIENMSKVTSIKNTFSNSGIINITLDTSNVGNFSSAFSNCYNLTDVVIDGSNAGNMSSTPFNRCSKLTNLTITNIKVNCVVGSGTSYGHLLTIESLLGLCQECINVNAARTLTVGSENITKLSSIYVKLTGEAETDETKPKLPMIQCESTDEGAMLVADYMALKQWSLA